MTGLIWDAETLATGAQLLLAATLAVHVLVVRPRNARESLALTARIIGDDVTLDQNHGLLPVRDTDVERVRQFLARVVHDPATAKCVLLSADAELAANGQQTAENAPLTVDQIRVEAYLTRLADACARYQHDAWPLNGAAQRARHAFRPSPGPLATPRVDTAEEAGEPRFQEPVIEEPALDESPAEEAGESRPAVIDLGGFEPRRIDLDRLGDDVRDDRQNDPEATVERAAVSPENFDLEERRVTTRLRARIDLTRLKQGGDRTVQVPIAPPSWRPPTR
jgi:hypothetical protein